MEEGKIIKALVNVGDIKLVEAAYNDVASPSMKKIGQALGTVVDLANTVLWPVKWFNERSRIFFEENLKKYERKLNSVAPDKIVQVPSEIAIPILERFKHVSNEDISNAFVNLLASASSADTIHLAHPGFVSVIDRISPDEAKIIKYFAHTKAVMSYALGWYVDDSYRAYETVFYDETIIPDEVKLGFADNIIVYLDNLRSLGVIEKVDWWHKDLEPQVERIVEKFKDKIASNRPAFVTPEIEKQALSTTRSMYRITDFGNLFAESCIEP